MTSRNTTTSATINRTDLRYTTMEAAHGEISTQTHTVNDLMEHGATNTTIPVGGDGRDGSGELRDAIGRLMRGVLDPEEIDAIVAEVVRLGWRPPRGWTLVEGCHQLGHPTACGCTGGVCYGSGPGECTAPTTHFAGCPRAHAERQRIEGVQP